MRGSVEGAVQESATTVTGGASVEKGDRDPEPSQASEYIAPLRLLLRCGTELYFIFFIV
mgnify:FL=1